MLSVIFANIGYLWTLLGLTTIVFCFKTKQVISGITIFFTILPAWTDAIWFSPENMLGTHLTILLVAWTFIHSQIAGRIIVCLYLMALADGLAILYTLVFNAPVIMWGLFAWQSTINILFLYMCVVTFRWCWCRIKTGKERECSQDAKFLARVTEHLHGFK